MDSILSWIFCNKTIYKTKRSCYQRKTGTETLHKTLIAINFLPTSYNENLLHRLKEANSFLPVHSWMLLSTKQQYRKSAWNDELTCKRRRHGHAVDQSLDVITMSTPPRQRLPWKRRRRRTSRNMCSCVSFGATEASLSAPWNPNPNQVRVRVRVSGVGKLSCLIFIFPQIQSGKVFYGFT
jgi:hypothetical protein